MGEADFTAACAEVERLHRVLQGWLSGTVPHSAEEFAAFSDSHSPEFTLITGDGAELTRDRVMGAVRSSHGSAARLRIRTHGTRLVAADARLLVAAFSEQHSGTPDACSRRCTAVLERDPSAPHGPRWRHLQETCVQD
ncbi:hypothetical protein LP52_09320 [Streptomonospora alba]|uniref:DUF4440 domain-containing protein n=1 Tax=Streptomonospora alba TaxID=183763 RepID=A0A0C2G6X0_9ACTN|nr:hypothetical protein [Streptomonospora alba]KIH99058.1 hypothetical protein LP52_09320 [Streptomonospora alba]